MLKSYFGRISETIKARDLIFGIGTPYDMENKRVQSGPQTALPPKVGPPTCQNLILIRSQRLLKLET